MSTQTVGQAVASVPKAVEVAKANRERFDAVLPRHIEAKSFVGLAESALYRDDKLMLAANNNPQAFYGALMKCASLGHRPGTEEYYLVPRKVKGQLQIQGIEGYRGIVERMYRSGAVASVIVREVCENDRFEYVEGVTPKPVHEVDWFGTGRGRMIGVYAYAMMTTGAVSRVVILNREDVMKSKAKSDGADSEYSPWQNNERAMWWKTAARRLEPWVPTSVEFFKERVRAAAELSHTTTERPAQAAQPETGQGDDVVDAELVEDGPGEFGSDAQPVPDEAAPDA
jgi:recombination protein RecT